MMAKTLKATTRIDAGDKGTFEPGDEVTGLEDRQMQQLFNSGAVSNEYEAAALPDEFPTTPRVIRDSLKVQESANVAGVDSPEGALTQPKADAPDEPGKLDDASQLQPDAEQDQYPEGQEPPEGGSEGTGAGGSRSATKKAAATKSTG